MNPISEVPLYTACDAHDYEYCVSPMAPAKGLGGIGGLG